MAGAIAKVAVRDLDLFFKVKYFKCSYVVNGKNWDKNAS